MSLIGKEVRHELLGFGRIKNIHDAYIEVCFVKGGTKLFQYPWALQSLLSLQDSESADLARKILQEAYTQELK